MKYDFNKVVDRRNSGSVKWDVKDNELPMWIADMDFEAAPCIRKALAARVKHGVYGYHEPGKDWFLAYQSFYKDEYGLEIPEGTLFFSTGVVPCLSSSVRALTEVGDEVIVLPPVYNIFYNSIRNSHRIIKEVPLLFDQEKGAYSLDFSAIEEAFSSPKAKLCLFCNPGNPTARIWSKEELSLLAELGKKHGVIILSDEIHGPVTRPNRPYVPFFTVSKTAKEVGVAALSPTKAFNLAGIQTSAICILNPEIKAKVERQLNTDECAEPNVFATVAAIAAFNEGREWLHQLREYLFDNRDYATAFIKENIPSLRPIRGDATYLLWIDGNSICPDSRKLVAFLRERTGLRLNDGEEYGKGGEGFFRLNLACPRVTLFDGLDRLKEGIEAFINEDKKEASL